MTQFEALTAAALIELADREVDAAVVEAGLGGRWDATNVLPSSVQVLTNVGLEHTRWLGPTIADIAAEKVDVVRPGGTLVIGPDLHPDARAAAERVVAERGATLIEARIDDAPELPGYQRRNFAVARAAAEAFLGELDPDAVAEAARQTTIPGRLQFVDEQLVLDGAHNPAGMEALAASLPAVVGERRLVAVVSILEDKDAAAMLRVLLPLCDDVVFCKAASPRALSPATLASLGAQVGGVRGTVAVERDVNDALALARERAGRDGVVLVTGSIYLLGDLLRPRGARPGATL